jgi:hypothetical protein
METEKDKPIKISDQTARKVIKMAEQFFSDPENVKAYEVWYLKKYGRLPPKEN